MRLRAPSLLPKTRALVEAIADGLTGYLTYRARCGRSLPYSEDVLRPPIVSIATARGWHIGTDLRVTHTTAVREAGIVDYVLTHVPARKAARTSQCIMAQVRWVPHKHAISPLQAENEVTCLHQLRRRYRRDRSRSELLTTCILSLVGPPARGPGGATIPIPVAPTETRIAPLYTFACHAAASDYGVTTYLVWAPSAARSLPAESSE